MKIPMNMRPIEARDTTKKSIPILDTRLTPNQFTRMMAPRVSRERTQSENQDGPRFRPVETRNASTAPMMYIAPDRRVAT